MVDFIASKKAVSLGPPKEAALYFDQVYPFDMSDTMLKKVGFIKGDIDPNAVPISQKTWDSHVLESILGSREAANHYIDMSLLSFAAFVLRSSRGDIEFLGEVRGQSRDEFDTRLSSRFGFKLADLLKPGEDPGFDLNRLVRAIFQGLKGAGFENAPDWNAEWADKTRNPKIIPQESDRFVATLRGLDLVDVDRVSWDTVVELRKDPKAMAELRAFRLFFTETFKEGDPNYLTDKILHLHERHKDTAKIWGMRTAQRSLSVFLDKPTMASSTLIGTGLGLLGGPVAALGALVIPLGKAGLEIMQARIDAKEARLDKPLQYLTRLEELPVKETRNQ